VSERLEYLLDTNLLSETRKKRADAGVLAFLEEAEATSLYISVLTLGELRKGVAKKMRENAGEAQLLAGWVDGLQYSFAERILGIDAGVAKLWGEWSSERPRPVVDTLLAATAVRRGLTLVTRNLRDMQGIPVKLLNPWKEPPAVGPTAR
jgi:predicted nucleic acid-binding protein